MGDVSNLRSVALPEKRGGKWSASVIFTSPDERRKIDASSFRMAGDRDFKHQVLLSSQTRLGWMTLLRPSLYVNERLGHYNGNLQGSPGGADFSSEGNSYD